jgi:hypothetical protein
VTEDNGKEPQAMVSGSAAEILNECLTNTGFKKTYSYHHPAWGSQYYRGPNEHPFRIRAYI